MIHKKLEAGSMALLLVTATGCVNAQNLPAGSVKNAAEKASNERGRGIFSTIFGCDASGSKQVIGAAGGGVVGGMIGNRVAGKGKRKIGTAAGVAIGAAAGSALGCKLQRDDQRRAEEAAVKAAQTEQSQSWKNTATGASGSAEIVHPGGQLHGLVLSPAVQPADGYTGTGAFYVATANANVRTMPSLDGQVIGRLAQGEKIWVAGAAVETGWLLVTQGDVGKGYVSPALLQRTADAPNNCKVIRHSITLPGKDTEVENLRACLNADNRWVFEPVAT